MANIRTLKPFLALLLAGTAVGLFATGPASAEPVLGRLEPIDMSPQFNFTGSAGVLISGDGRTVFGVSYDPANGVPTQWQVGSTGPGNTIMQLSQTSTLQDTTPDGRFLVGYGQQNIGYVLDRQADALFNLPIYAAQPGSIAYAISDDGGIVVGTSSNSQALVWTRTGSDWSSVTATALPNLEIVGQARANDIAGDGNVIVGQSRLSGADNYHAVYWESGAITDIGPSGSQSSADKISRDGSTIAGVIYPNQGNGVGELVTWTGPGFGTMTNYGNITGHSARVGGISGDGSVIVGNYMVEGQTLSAYVLRDGEMRDLNDALSAAGLDLGGAVLMDAPSVSDDGRYIVANDGSASDPAGYAGYVVFYDGQSAGMSSTEAQLASVAALARDRQRAGIAQDGVTGLMIGDFDGSAGETEVGVFGLYGSAEGGIRFRAGLADGLSLTGGLSAGTEGGANFSYGNAEAALALRFDLPAPEGAWHGFAQVGGSLGTMPELSFERSYANGSGTTTATGETTAVYGSAFARAGLSGALGTDTSLELAGELGQRWLDVAEYYETQAGNPFAAFVQQSTDTQTVAKLSATLSGQLGERFDYTLRGALATTIGTDGEVFTAIAGFGETLTAVPDANWAELGLRIGYEASDTLSFDAYALAMGGGTIDTAAQVGLGMRLGF